MHGISSYSTNENLAKEYQKKIFADGIPATTFGVTDVHKEYARLLEKGIKFTMEPTEMGEVTMAVFDDTMRQSDSNCSKIT